jgi:ABC-type branched-subunit amino acid transport system substrate-binding protein
MIEEVLAVEVITSAHDAGLAVYERVATGIVDANVEVWYAQLAESKLPLSLPSGVCLSPTASRRRTDGKAEERARWRCDSQSCRCSYQEETNCAVEEAHGFDGHTGVYVAHDDAASTCEYTVTDRPQLPDWDFALYQLCRVQDGGVTRLISPRLERRLPEVWTLLQSFRIGRTEVEEILRKHPSHPDSTAASIHEAACEWLRESPETWGPWVTAAVERAQLKPNVTIGLVFPAQEFGDVDEQLQLAGAQLAIEHVNQDETILRGVRLQPLLVPSSLARLLNSNKGTAEYIADEAQSLNQRLLQGGAVAVVGAGYSSDVKALAPAIELPILSPSATAAALSNTTAYPRFGRLCISDKFQAQALADIVQFYGFQRIGMIFCDDVYCEGLAAGTKAELAASGVRVEFEQRIRSKMQGGDLDAVIALLEKDLTSCADGADEHTTATLLITHEYELLLGASAKAELKTAWIGSESLGSNGQAGPKSLQSGAVSLRQSADLDNARYDAFVSGVPSAAQDLFAVNAYDAVWAYAHAMEALYAQGISVYDQTELLEQLAALNFRGASGSVVFDESIDRRGSYQIVSFLNGELQVVGSWTAVDRSISASKQLDFDTSPNKYRPCADSNESDNLMTIALAAVGIVLVVLAPIIWFVTIWRRRLRLSRQSFTTFLSHTKDEGAAHAMSLNASFDKALLRRSCCCLPSGRGDNFVSQHT